VIKAHGPRAEASEAKTLIAELEGALIEYVERFGPTENARRALKMSSIWHAQEAGDPSTKVGS